MSLKRDEVTVRSEFVNYSRFNDQHIFGDPCGRFNKIKLEENGYGFNLDLLISSYE